MITHVFRTTKKNLLNRKKEIMKGKQTIKNELDEKIKKKKKKPIFLSPLEIIRRNRIKMQNLKAYILEKVMTKKPIAKKLAPVKKKKEEHAYCGKCIFCVSVCPECKSTNVNVNYDVRFSSVVGEKDKIEIDGELELFEINCHECAEQAIYQHDDLGVYDKAIGETYTSIMEVTRKDGKISFGEIVYEC
jgi:hypothetical protein